MKMKIKKQVNDYIQIMDVYTPLTKDETKKIFLNIRVRMNYNFEHKTLVFTDQTAFSLLQVLTDFLIKNNERRDKK